MPAIRNFVNQDKRLQKQRFRAGIEGMGLFLNWDGSEIYNSKRAYYYLNMFDTQYPFKNLAQYSPISHYIRVFEGTTFSDVLIDQISDLHESIYSKPLTVEYH